jgi:hypothetical protein
MQVRTFISSVILSLTFCAPALAAEVSLGETGLVPEMMQVTVRNPNPVEWRGVAGLIKRLGWGDTCLIATGQTITAVGSLDEDHVLVRYDAVADFAVTGSCPSIYFISTKAWVVRAISEKRDWFKVNDLLNKRP